MNQCFGGVKWEGENIKFKSIFFFAKMSILIAGFNYKNIP